MACGPWPGACFWRIRSTQSQRIGVRRAGGAALVQLIRSIQVEGFRSIQAADLSPLSGFTSLVGRNSSGKSNVLRALNLFFNDELEPGRPLSFARDAYDEVPRLKKKKRITVTLEIAVPANFRFRKGLDALGRLGPSFTVRRTWEMDPRRQVIGTSTLELNGAPVENGADLARQFLGLVAFRYIPNRTVPARLLRDESQAIASAIFRWMRGGDQGAELLRHLSEASTRLLQDASDSLSSSGSPLTRPSVATTESIGQMLQMSGFQAVGRHGGVVQDEDWGAGHQAFFLYSLLRAIDTDVSRSFGWRQAAIWAVEEPESALHRDLEIRLADELRSWSLQKDSRLQILQTTHSPIMTMASESGFWVELDGKKSSFSPMSIPELTRAAELRGVSGWVHPILSFPWNAVVLVEGETDAEVLAHVAGLAGIDSLRFLHLPALDPNESGGGKDAVAKYLRANTQLIAHRPHTAPLVVLFDWDVSNDAIAKARTAYGSEAERLVIRMDDSHCPSELGRTFKGIERFYPPKVIAEAHDADEIIVGMRTGRPYSVASDELSRGKRRLQARVLQVRDLGKLQPLLTVVRQVDSAARGPSGPQLELPRVGESETD